MATEPIIVKIAESSKDWSDYLTLAADLLGPIVTAIFGVWILLITKKIEHSQWRNQKLIERRIAAWDEVSPRINDIFCYCTRVGHWKNVSPKDVIAWKREVDKMIYINRPYFSALFFTRFMEFMNACFAMYQGHGVDAKIKTPLWEHRSAHSEWKTEWDSCFQEPPTSEEEFRTRYLALQRQLSAELNVV